MGVATCCTRPSATLLAGVLLLGCGGGAKSTKASAAAAPSAQTAEVQAPPRPADAAADMAYYREHAPGIARRDPSALTGTDWKRLRRGRLYVGGVTGYPKELGDALGEAIKRRDDAAVVSAATRIIEEDATDVEAHLVLAAAHRKLGHGAEADFHRQLGFALLDSIKESGTGQSFDSPWLVFQVKEEYHYLRAGGFKVTKQSLVPKGDRQFDVLEAKSDDDGKTAVFYFDVTELLDEEGRSFGGQ